jgi:hypothetical protein
MRGSGRIRPMILSLILCTGIILTVGAAPSFGGSARFKGPGVKGTSSAAHSFGTGRFTTPRIDRQPSFLRPFHDLDSSGRFRPRQRFFLHPSHRFGFLGGGGVSEEPVIIIQQLQPAAAPEPSEPATNRIYVQPRWVDGGHGVEILQPGHWTDPKRAAER